MRRAASAAIALVASVSVCPGAFAQSREEPPAEPTDEHSEHHERPPDERTDASPDVHEEHPPNRGGIALAGGGTLQTWDGIPVTGFEGLATLGGRVFGVEGTFVFGRTQYGLSTRRLSLGSTFDARAGRWTAGLVFPCFGWVSISRATNGNSLEGGTLGVSGHVAWDAWQGRSWAFFLLARGLAEVGALPIVGGALSAGLRYGGP
jgi:hypothetical protein